MHDVSLMQFSNSYDNLGSVEFDNILAKSLLFLKDLVKLAAIDERHDEVKTSI